MRALLLALLITITTGCSSKTEQSTEQFTGKPSEARPSGGVGPAVSVADQNKATEELQARNENKVLEANAKEAADSDAAKTHKVVNDKLQASFDVADRRFNSFKAKVVKVTEPKKASVDAAVADVTKREATVMASIAKLRDASGAAWDAAKTQVEADTVALNTAIDALETALR